MKLLTQSFPVHFQYNVYFTSHLFECDNPVFASIITAEQEIPKKVLLIVENTVTKHHPHLLSQIKDYFLVHNNAMTLCGEPYLIDGGETIKNDSTLVNQLYQRIHDLSLCRHSYIVMIGGGAALDLVGYVAATAHRGIRLIRVPTTTLAQGDSGVGVKNSINFLGKKNFIGTFAPPYAVINDPYFLETLDDRDWRAGVAEAIKVALIKDAGFFELIQKNITSINSRKLTVMKEIIYHCAALHLDHIGTKGDPFEFGSSRPLDFGHWAAHKLEHLTNYRLRHGEAVAIGVALDSTYSYLAGWLAKENWQQILEVFTQLNFQLYVPELAQQMQRPQHPDSIFKGLTEFREHLGGQLTLMMLDKIGTGREIHEVNFTLYRKAIALLKKMSCPQF